MKNVVIIGTGGHAKVVADIVLCTGDRIVGFLTSDAGKESFLGFPVLGNNEAYLQHKDAQFVIAIGDAVARERISNLMEDVAWYTAIHPSAVISNLGTSIGQGTVIMANAVVNSYATIGKHCIINTRAVVEHDNSLSDYVHVSPGANLAGTVSVGSKTWIGVGATVRNNITICSNCMIGAGAVVVKNITEPGTYIGCPVRQMNSRKN